MTLNIIVCLNFLPDINIISLDTGQGSRINKEDLVYRVHPSDLVALEEAVRLKEAHGSGRVILAALSSPSAERLLRQCLAIGADEAILIDDLHFKNPDGYLTGVILAAGCRAMNFDLILCGHGSLDSLGGQTGYVMADLLNLPVVSRVTKIAVLPGQKSLQVEKRLERGYRERLELPLPAILTLEEGLNQPRYASLPHLLKALRKEMKRVTRADLNFSPGEDGHTHPRLELLDMKTPKPRPKKIFTPDTNLSAEDRMWQIMSGGLDAKNKGRELFEGSPEELSSKFLDYLKQIQIEPAQTKNQN